MGTSFAQYQNYEIDMALHHVIPGSINNFVDVLSKPLCSVSELNLWERLVDQGEINKYGISNIYKMLIPPQTLGPHVFWFGELGI